MTALEKAEAPAANTSMGKDRGRRWITIVAYLVVFHTLLAYGLPTGVFLLLAILAGVLYARVGAIGSVAVTLALLAVTLFYSLALSITGFENAIYFRPDERLSTFDYRHHHRIFQPGATLEMQMPHGDLQSMTPLKIAEPRPVIYHIDSSGFRNDADYQGQRYLLVGDSFVVGTGNSQADMLSAQLRRDYAIDAYNLAHPGDVVDYAGYVAGFKATHQTDAKVLLFIFEGNDFVESRVKRHSAVTLFFKRYSNLFSSTNVFRVTKSLTARATRSSKIAGSQYLTMAELHAKKIAFLTGYVEAARRASLPPIGSFERAIQSMGGDIGHIFFIPTKYRVYYKHINPGEVLPSAAWDYLQRLCQKNHLACTNLTQPLVEASDELLTKGELTWWRDDTHWNRNGIAVAARVVAASLTEASMVRPGK
jgi:hypothetical protein